MAETMTYDPGTDTVTTEENLTPEEQESLAVGEEMEAQQEQLLAGKYKNAQELEKAYAELEAKLGDRDKEESEATESEDTDTPTSGIDKEQLETFAEEMRPAVELITEASLEFDSEGKMSADTVAKFNQLSSKDLVNAYQEIQTRAAQAQPQGEDLTNAEVNTIHNSVGGADSYQQVLNWAEDNLPPGTIESYDSLCDTGNAQAIELAIKGLKAQYDDANGYEGRMLQGKGPKSSNEVYRSQAEVVQAMSDPRYDNDPAYRQDVMEKLNRSNIQF